MPYTSIEVLAERVLSRSEPDGDGCLIFAGSLQHGYGCITRGLGNGKFRGMRTHRVVWEAANGPIPEGMTIDHLCLKKACQNVDHMEVVTRSLNSSRAQWMNSKGPGNSQKTHCPHGHAYSKENTYIMPSGSRFCRECGNERTKAWQRKKAMQRAGGQQ